MKRLVLLILVAALVALTLTPARAFHYGAGATMAEVRAAEAFKENYDFRVRLAPVILQVVNQGTGSVVVLDAENETTKTSRTLRAGEWDVVVIAKVKTPDRLSSRPLMSARITLRIPTKEGCDKCCTTFCFTAYEVAALDSAGKVRPAKGQVFFQATERLRLDKSVKVTVVDISVFAED